MRIKTFGPTLLLLLLGTACGSNGAAPASNGGSAGSAGSSGTPSDGGAGASGAGGADGGAMVQLALQVSPAKEQHAISPLIYGVNGAAAASTSKATLVRLGSNNSTAYDWEINATNGGRLEGYANCPASESTEPGGAAQEVLDQASKNAAAAIITIPIGDYVAADRNAGDVRTSTSYLSLRFDANNALSIGPFPTTPDLTDGNVYQDEFVNWVKQTAGKTPVLFALDNQPSLWFEDHPELHPQHTGYDELVTRDISYAKAIKSVWPSAPVLGYVGYGWQSFENLQNSPSADAKGEFIPYYLDQMQAAQAANGERLIDYLDVHWWSEVKGAGVPIIQADAGPEVVAARLQAPRELWDPDYRETSWIQDVLGNETIHLIPRLQQEIAAHYPGTKLSFSAWYYGGGDDISGAIATADVLGIFGRESVGAAALELSDGNDAYTLAGLSAYLDYDGHGARFGDTSVSATSNDRVGSSVYASIDSSDPTHLVIVTMNKRLEERPTTLTIDGSTTYKSCRVYKLTSDSPRFVGAPTLSASAPNTFDYDQPRLSVSVIVPEQ